MPRQLLPAAGLRHSRVKVLIRVSCGFLLVCMAVPAGMLPAQDSTQTAQSQVPYRSRASWLSDKRTFLVGEILTVTVDERVVANERSDLTATSNHSNKASLDAGNSDISFPFIDVGGGTDASQKELGAANRRRNLTAVMSVQVIGFDPGGSLKVRGERKVVVDGREQTIALEGLVRPEDVSQSNRILSTRIANASISYEGTTIKPKKGLLHSILSIFLP